MRYSKRRNRETSIKKHLLNNRNIDVVSGCWNWNRCTNGSGYGVMEINWQTHYVHRLSAQFFLGLAPTSMAFVLHKCDNRRCFNPKHLFLGTQSDNIRDMITKGRGLTGEKSPHAKLNWEKVSEIRKALACGDTKSQIARKFGVCRRIIRRIGENKTWRTMPTMSGDLERA